MEFLPIEGTVPRLIESDAPLAELVAAARPFGMQTLWEGGLSRLWMGLTSADELQRVLGDGPDHPANTVTPEPIAPANGAEPVEPILESNDGPATVLLADDDAAMRRLLRAVLEREGFQVIEATDGREALEVARRERLQLIILDQDMPNLTGLEALEALRSGVSTLALPVIMLSARTDDTELAALELGANDFLTKPVQPRSLVARVRAVLRRSAMS